MCNNSLRVEESYVVRCCRIAESHHILDWLGFLLQMQKLIPMLSQSTSFIICLRWWKWLQVVKDKQCQKSTIHRTFLKHVTFLSTHSFYINTEQTRSYPKILIPKLIFSITGKITSKRWICFWIAFLRNKKGNGNEGSKKPDPNHTTETLVSCQICGQSNDIMTSFWKKVERACWKWCHCI